MLVGSKQRTFSWCYSKKVHRGFFKSTQTKDQLVFPLRVLHLFFTSNYFLATIASSTLPPITFWWNVLICLRQEHLHRNTHKSLCRGEAMQVQRNFCCHNISIVTGSIAVWSFPCYFPLCYPQLNLRMSIHEHKHRSSIFIKNAPACMSEPLVHQHKWNSEAFKHPVIRPVI